MHQYYNSFLSKNKVKQQLFFSQQVKISCKVIRRERSGYWLVVCALKTLHPG